MRTNVAASTRAFLERTQEQELVGEAQEAALVAALNQYQGKLGRLFTTWIHRRERSSLPPFGLLEVQCDDHGFVVARNGAPLQHSTCRPGRASIFLTRQAAQVAAELNMTLGWGSYGREPDCLSFTWSDDSHLGEKHKDVRCGTLSALWLAGVGVRAFPTRRSAPSGMGRQMAGRGGLGAPRVLCRRQSRAARHHPPVRGMRLEPGAATMGA
jgi:hypothetical protein